MKYDIRLKYLSALTKVFPNMEPTDIASKSVLSGLFGETISFQVGYYYNELITRYGKVSVNSDIKNNVKIREVKLVPANYPCHPNADDKYLCKSPGLFPDLLTDIQENKIQLIRGQWRSLWIDVELTEEMVAGKHKIDICFDILPADGEEGIESVKISQEIEVIPYLLPMLSIPHTEWFHGDCIADYYDVDVFSDEHWVLLERFIDTAVKRDCNMLLTPIFTPPLDTAKGGERTTIQLVDIYIDEGKYRFDFSKFKQWVKIAKNCGVSFFEMSHLFTQWGAIAAPKIMAYIDGHYNRLFGWETPATSKEYVMFLSVFIPKLIDELKGLDIDKVTYFHISDEPNMEQLDTYKKAVEIIQPLLEGYPIIDALSDYEFYQKGLVKQPVCAINHIHTFIENKVEKLWSYYCTAQGVDVSNRFMAMSSSRNRIYGVQIYKFDMTGILHWGYNFYNSQDSLTSINPYLVTDCQEAYPSGDSFLVYPGVDGYPEESIRMMVHYHAMTDYRAFKLLEKFVGKDEVIRLLEEGLEQEIDFFSYPLKDDYLLTLRHKVNEELKKYVA